MVVGNNEPTGLRKMSGSGNESITIPSVFVSRETYNEAVTLLTDPSENVQATLNILGEAADDDDTWNFINSLRLAGLLMLTLPVIWCIATIFLIVRKVRLILAYPFLTGFIHAAVREACVRATDLSCFNVWLRLWFPD